MVSRAEQKAARTTEQALDDARRIRTEANADATAERRSASDDARQMINEASTHRRTVLTELSRRRDLACSQLSDLLRGREVLVQSLAHLAGTAGDLIARLDAISAEPTDFVNLDPGIDGPGTVVDQNAVLSVTEGTRWAARLTRQTDRCATQPGGGTDRERLERTGARARGVTDLRALLPEGP